MKSKAPAPPLDAHELDELILKVLSRNRFGLPPSKILKELPPSHRPSGKHLAARLEDLLAGGRVHAWNPPIGKAKKPPAPIYSLEPLLPNVSGQIIRLLTSNKPLTPSEIKKQLPAHISKDLQIFLDPLLKERKVKWHPPVKGKRLGLQEPDPRDFLSAEIKKIFAKGEKLGFKAEDILQAVQAYTMPLLSKKPLLLTPREAEKIIFKMMTTIKPAAAQGALVYIPDLRQAMGGTFPDKESFDQAILELAKMEKVQLQSHSLPAELTEDQRADMIDNGRGSYFMAIGIRME
jgi:hypothetical protein